MNDLKSIELFIFIMYLFVDLFIFPQQEEWNAHNAKIIKFIKTKTKPPLLYLPGRLCPATQKLLDESQKKMNGKASFGSLQELRLNTVWQKVMLE